MDLRRVLDEVQPIRHEPPRNELQELKSVLTDLRREVKILQAQVTYKPERKYIWMVTILLISVYTTILAIVTRLIH